MVDNSKSGTRGSIASRMSGQHASSALRRAPLGDAVGDKPADPASPDFVASSNAD